MNFLYVLKLYTLVLNYITGARWQHQMFWPYFCSVGGGGGKDVIQLHVPTRRQHMCYVRHIWTQGSDTHTCTGTL